MAHNHDASAWSEHSDKWASSVQQITAAPCRELLNMMLMLSPPVHESPKFFDNGAGSGMFTSTILQANPKARITAADVSSGMINTLKAEAKKQGWTTVTTLVADASDLRAAGIKDGSFTFTAGTAFLPFVQDPAKVVAEMARITEPSGIVAVSTWSRVSWVPLWEEAVQKTLDSSYKAPALFHPGTTERDDVADLLLGAGLQNVTAKEAYY
ncbi:putative methyltransferase type 11, S-adenosyl-L-methionine-dependent methyltransferase [Septoria linicola]|nr:putative methyltransferase type 11, S-adenosyl-L-methionine-dependent methyltransferase [Septoria linicola]